MERICFGTPSPRTSSKITFALFVFGWALLCGGSVLSIYGFASCQSDSCNTYKVIGPVLAGIGLACSVMAELTAIRERRRRELEGDPSDPDRRFICGKSRRFAQFLIPGILLLACGVLLSIPGLVLPDCRPASITEKTAKVCVARMLKIAIFAVFGLCSCIAACVSANYPEEDPEVARDQPVRVTAGDEVFMFPPPPPPHSAGGHDRPMSEDSSSSHSGFFQRGDHESSGRDGENECNVPRLCWPTVQYIDERLPLEPPPRNEDIFPTPSDPLESSSPYYSVSESSESSDYELAPEP
ncbi:transmembrane protein 171-like [Spea bombifrons]|uniref:transmembrane protein 171-like n=1 Tax=Spea bombifrons TaxID=233779 RepID=UPI002349DDD1|nr:transmembrane protein 171-like [Spea bombifrons]